MDPANALATQTASVAGGRERTFLDIGLSRAPVVYWHPHDAPTLEASINEHLDSR